MSDELRSAMRAEADQTGAARPDAADLWRTGRRRRSARRALSAAAVVVVALVVGAAALAVATSDSGEQVRTADVPATVEPGSCDPAPTSASQAPPATIDEFVDGPAAPGAAGGPTKIVRAIVERAYWFGPADLSSDPVSWYRIATLQVIDPVSGARLGDVLEVVVADPQRPAPATDLTDASIFQERKEVQQRIDELQAEVDEIDRPLAELDAQIYELDPADPQVQALLDDRVRVKEQTDRAREEAQERLSAEHQELRRLDLAEAEGTSPAPPAVTGPPCWAFAEGDDVIIALTPEVGDDLYGLASPSSFFVIGPDGTFSPDLDAARRSVPSWGGDSELLRLARGSTPDEFLDRLREAGDGG